MYNHHVNKGTEALSTYSLSDTHNEKRCIRWRYRVVLILPILLLSLFDARAQNAYAVHANIIYRFTNYINWPDDKKTGEFIIGVVGETPLFDELQNFTSKKIT